MSKIIVYGTGKYYQEHKMQIVEDNEIVAYADSYDYTSLTGRMIEGVVILGPHEISEMDADYIWICTDFYLSHRIYQMLIKNGVHSGKIKFLNRYWDYHATENGKGLISQINGVKIKEEHLTDFDIVHEIFVERVYNLSNLKKHTVVVDMGMNIGAASLYFAKNDNVDAIYGFEPFKDTYEQAICNFEMNSSYIKNKIHPFNYGLLDCTDILSVDITAEETGWRNILSTNDNTPKTKIISKDVGEVLRKIVDENKNAPILIKMDVEASEYRIFPRLIEENIFEHVYALLMEYHGDSDILESMLIEQGFKVFAFGTPKGIGMLYAIK